MSGERKLGLTFLGILVAAFCGVLTMRLMGGRSTDDKVEVNVGGPLAEAPAAASPSPSSTAPARPESTRAPGADSFAARTPAPPPAYLPPPSAMRSAAEATPPPPSGSSDPFSRGPVAASAPIPAGYTPPPATAIPPTVSTPPVASAAVAPATVAPSAVAPSAVAGSPSPYGGSAAPAAGSSSGGGAASLSAPPFSTAGSPPAPFSNDSVPPAPLSSTAGNPLRGAAPSAATASAEPTLPTGGAGPGDGTLTGRSESSVTFSPPSAFSTGRSAPAVGAAGSGSGASEVGFAPPGGAGRLTADRDVAVASAALPAASKDKPYVVAPDDSFWSISEKAYGNGAYYRALFQYNRDRYPNAEDVRPGSVLDIPPLDVLKRQFPELTTGADGASTGERTSFAAAVPAPPVPATYVVKEGDTLIAIAREQLGKAARWTEIYELNRGVLGENLENLRPGVELRLK